MATQTKRGQTMTNISIRTTDSTNNQATATVRSGEFKGKQSTDSSHEAAARKLANRLGFADVTIGAQHGNGWIFTINTNPVETPTVVEVPAEEIGVPAEEDAPAALQVETRYVGPTGFKGAMIGARMLSGEHSGRRVKVGYDYAARDAHVVAVHALLAKVGVDGSAVDSGKGIDNGYVYDVITG